MKLLFMMSMVVLAVKCGVGGLLRFDVPVTGIYLIRIGDMPAHRDVGVR